MGFQKNCEKLEMLDVRCGERRGGADTAQSESGRVCIQLLNRYGRSNYCRLVRGNDVRLPSVRMASFGGIGRRPAPSIPINCKASFGAALFWSLSK